MQPTVENSAPVTGDGNVLTGHHPSAGSASAATGSGSARLLSLDALRGFDMFWLLGGEHIVHGLCAGAAAGSFAWALDQQF